MNILSRITITFFAGALAAMAADPLIGTWKVIPESVKPGGDGPKKVVMRYEPTDVPGEVKFTLTAEMNGRPYGYSWTSKPNAGRFSVKGQTTTQEVEFQRAAENHTITIHYRDGQEVVRHDSTISRGGKVLTTKSTAKTRAGETVESESQYQKQ